MVLVVGIRRSSRTTVVVGLPIYRARNVVFSKGREYKTWYYLTNGLILKAFSAQWMVSSRMERLSAVNRCLDSADAAYHIWSSQRCRCELYFKRLKYASWILSLAQTPRRPNTPPQSRIAAQIKLFGFVIGVCSSASIKGCVKEKRDSKYPLLPFRLTFCGETKGLEMSLIGQPVHPKNFKPNYHGSP